jgi:cell division protein ZapE
MRADPPVKTVVQALSDMVRAGAAQADPAQEELAAALDRVLACLSQRRTAGPLKRLLGSRGRADPCAGLYVHGGVGRGKTMLMDVFFGLAPVAEKRRVHFNAFMQDVHARIARQRRTAARDPVRPVARQIAAEAQLLCVDEFAVNDIADAMILGRLFAGLFAQGVCLVATSNVAPGELYRDGLNRQLFLPFLDLLAERCPPIGVTGGKDYRLGAGGGHGAWFAPLTQASIRAFEARWRAAADGNGEGELRLPLRGRELVVPRAAGHAARFAFGQLCGAATGSEDYLALAGRFSELFLEGVPMMDLSRRNEAKRFILLVDCLYDRRVRLIASAEAGPHALYCANTGVERLEFPRTISRLVEMQSDAYGAAKQPV